MSHLLDANAIGDLRKPERRAARLHVPDPRPERDALIAATAAVHGFAVVTRNVKDFDSLGVAVINPWGDAAGS